MASSKIAATLRPHALGQSIAAHAPPAGIGHPAMTLLGSEPWRAARELVSHALTRAPRAGGDGHPVIIFPGLASSGIAVTPLRAHCRALGYAAFDWGQGYNRGPGGDFDAWLSVLEARIDELLEPFSQSATLIGWSLGGLYARELAKRMAPRVRQVITFGTPFNASADHTNVGWLFRLLSGNAARLDPAMSARLRRPPPLPTTSIYSRADGVVAWQTCRHAEASGFVEDIEIDGSHIGMGWNPRVLEVVADRLAQAPGQWRRYADQQAPTSDPLQVAPYKGSDAAAPAPRPQAVTRSQLFGTTARPDLGAGGNHFQSLRSHA